VTAGFALLLLVLVVAVLSSSSGNGPSDLQRFTPAFPAAYVHGYKAGQRFMPQSDANATKGECDQMVNTLLGGYSRVRDQDNGWMGGCQDAVTGKQPLLGVDRYERRSSTLGSS
jgi:hypothetical protein